MLGDDLGWLDRRVRNGAADRTDGDHRNSDGSSGSDEQLRNVASHDRLPSMNSIATAYGRLHKHRNLLAHAPERLHEEIGADYTDMIYAATSEEIEARRKAFIRKWRLKHRAVADSLEEAGERLFTFTRLPPSQWRSARTTNAIERLHEEFKRRIKTQTVLPSAETAAMLFWALLASGQINMRKVNGWKTLATKPIEISRLTSQPETITSCYRDCATPISNHVRAAGANIYIASSSLSLHLEAGRLNDRHPARQFVGDHARRLLRPGIEDRLEARRDQRFLHLVLR